jgi:CRISPR/Cas system endoribonuclease Cas6 (RAMP superfamily)
VRIEFLTPTELKSKDQIADVPEFPILFGRIRDRLSTLSALYGGGPLAIDFAALGERAEAVRLAQCDIHPVSAKRRSGRTGQIHPVGGFVGSAEYEGELAEFLPYLEAARWTGVGRQTVWGKGEIRVSPDERG